MLTDDDLKELQEKANRLTDIKIDQALRFAYARKDHPLPSVNTERIDAWIMALRMEQARRAGKLRTLTDRDTTALARLWIQISNYRDSLRRAGLEVDLQINEIDRYLVRVSMVISGPTGAVGRAIEQSSMG